MESFQLYYVIAFYIFTAIEDPKAEVKKHHEFFSTRDIRSRIYISHEGINAQMSASKESAQEYMDWMKQDERFKGIDFKIHFYKEHAFPRATVKFKKQLVALDREVDIQEGGQHLWLGYKAAVLFAKYQKINLTIWIPTGEGPNIMVQESITHEQPT
ncbi:MAG: hypothetical protein EBZ47_06145, partial [Chlamydiae bacterium]|nr:hypothetical protein [Chlamydiota bacterium]